MAEMAFDPEDENIKQLSNFYTHKNEEPISIKTLADMSRKIQEHLSDLLG
jgi:hypothetical protein